MMALAEFAFWLALLVGSTIYLWKKAVECLRRFGPHLHKLPHRDNDGREGANEP